VLAGSVILYWMWGCSSQLEAFGPKPAAPDECRGAFGASWNGGVQGQFDEDTGPSR